MSLERRIRAELEARIHSGEWRPGDRIPFEHELVETYRCARGTVTRALEGLARSGLIQRRRKAGSFVAHPHVQSAVLEVPDLERLVTARCELYSWACRVKRRANPAAMAGSEIGGPALLVEGLHCGGGRPLCLERRLISLAVAPQAEHADFTLHSPGTWLLDHVPWTRGRHGIRAIEAKRRDAAELEIRAGKACLEMTRTTWRLDEPVTEARQLFPGDRYDLIADFRPGMGA